MRTHVAAGGHKPAPRPRPASSAGADDGDGGAGTLSQRLRRAVAAYADADALACLSGGSGGSGGSWGQGAGARRALLSHDALRKYIEYARRHCHPRLTRAAAKVPPTARMDACHTLSLLLPPTPTQPF